MDWIKRHLSPSLVISIIALCVALGGTAFALAGNSVGARELKPIVLREEEHAIAPGATRVIDVKCHSGEQVTGAASRSWVIRRPLMSRTRTRAATAGKAASRTQAVSPITRTPRRSA
jgi:hypothetical protein